MYIYVHMHREWERDLKNILYLSLTLFFKWVKLLMVGLKEKVCVALST